MPAFQYNNDERPVSRAGVDYNVSGLENDPVIKLDSSLQMIEFESAGVDVMHVADKYIQAFVDIRCDSIVGADDPGIDARIDLGEKFVVAKGDHTERFSINVQSGAIKQTTSAYTAFVIDGSNETGALIRNACGAATYNFGATDLGWVVLDNVFNPLLTVTDEYATFSGDIRSDKIVGTSFSTDASIELFRNLTISTNGTERIRVSDTDIKAWDLYVPRSNTSLVTKNYVDNLKPPLHSCTKSNRIGMNRPSI